MSSRSVAVLDVRSSEVTVVVGERGVNNTFVFKASKTEPYDGYDESAFFDTDKLSDAVFRAVSAVERICGERLRHLYVGVPGAFTRVIPREQVIGFPKRRTIGHKDLAALFASGREPLDGYRCIRATSMIYVTSDDRRVVDPVGLSSASLSGVLSYFYCSDYFAETMERIFSGMKIELSFLPAEYAMATYLIPSETRDEYALFLDVGFMSSSLCVLLGNGVLAQRTYFVGKGQIAAVLMQRFSLPYDAAVALLAKANLFVRSNSGKTEVSVQGVSYEVDTDELIEAVKEGLDAICEAIGGFWRNAPQKSLISSRSMFRVRGWRRSAARSSTFPSV